MRGTALSEGIGEILTPLPPAPQCPVLIAKPSINVSTKFVYENLHLDQLSPADHPNIDGILTAIRDGQISGIAENLGNILERNIRSFRKSRTRCSVTARSDL